VLKFENYQVIKLLIDNNGLDEKVESNELGIHYKIIPNKSENFDKMNIIQGIKIFPSLENQYTIEAIICGNFSINRDDPDFTEDVLTVNCGAILYPYLRSSISLLSSQIDQKIILPTINFYKFIEDISKEDLFGEPTEYKDF
jgi:preprotein translocase subunit SecB